MNKEAKIIIDDICAHSVTFPSIPTTLISRKSYFDLFEEQFETYKVLCLPGAEGVGLTTALAEFAKCMGNIVFHTLLMVFQTNNGATHYRT